MFEETNRVLTGGTAEREGAAHFGTMPQGTLGDDEPSAGAAIVGTAEVEADSP